VAATAAVLVQLPDGGGRLMGETYNRPVAPVVGTPDAIAEHVDAMTKAGASHVQLVLDPITEQSIEVVGEALALLDA
jgi:alkanesulfonate monooxygenase SsuD/methylene tetrahydromethanopterin reductase-like flavin-dependent oxidoreductase (luciferase family)